MFFFPALYAVLLCYLLYTVVVVKLPARLYHLLCGWVRNFRYVGEVLSDTLENGYYRLEANVMKDNHWGLSIQESQSLLHVYDSILKVRCCESEVVVGTAFCTMINGRCCVVTAMHLFRTADNNLKTQAQRNQFCQERDGEFELLSSSDSVFKFNVAVVAEVQLFPVDDVAIIGLSNFCVPSLIPSPCSGSNQKCFVFGYSVNECDNGAVVQTVGCIKISRDGGLRYTADTNKGCSGGAVVVIENGLARVVAVHQGCRLLNFGRELDSFARSL
jgi:hypothetical protein